MLSTVLDQGASGSRTLNYKLAVDSSYTFSLSDVLTDPDMITGNRGLYFKSDFEALGTRVKAAGNTYTDDRFDFETGDYLMTPFDSKWTNPDNSKLQGDSPVIRDLYDIKTKPDGIANPTDDEIRANQPDVIMYMEYSGDKVEAGKTCPSNNIVTIRVNRRTMYKDTKDNTFKQQTNFKFILTFTDSYATYKSDSGKIVVEYKNVTSELVINVTVTNKAPYQFDTNTYRPVSNVNMRVGDTFTVLTTPADYFNGSAIYSSVSATASKSYANYASTVENTVIDPSLMCDANGKRESGKVETYKFNDLTLDYLKGDGRLHDATKETEKNAFLGYTAIATDDAPWTLRMTLKYDATLFDATAYDKMNNEDIAGVQSGIAPIDYTVKALSACTNQPITIIITDAEGDTYEYTMYITVESTPPKAFSEKDNGTTRALNDGLSYTKTDKMFDLYMRVSDGGNSGAKSVVLNTGDTVNAYSALDVVINRVAYDPDSNDDANIALYVGANMTDIFTINDKKLTLRNSDNVFYNEKFEIRITDDNYKSFNIKCKSYDKTSNEDYLKFYVRDVGNNVFANAEEITIHITTLYSSLYNDHSAKNTIIESNGTYTINAADTVNVKAYDVYNGVGMDLEDTRRGERSSYQFLDYAKAVDSIDNVGTDKYIKDPDVAVDNGADPENPDDPIDFNILNYDVRVYAFLDENNGYSSMELADISQYFDIKRDNYNAYNNYFRLKQTEDNLHDLRDAYLIGGRSANGSTYRNDINTKLLNYVNNYFEFSIGDDGVSILFRPISANINNKILLYVEAEKKVGAVAVYPNANNSSLVAGSLFYVNVEDSKPIANSDEDDELLSVRGSVVKSIISADGNSETFPEQEGVNTF
ncbi:MAG: hypothetical protein K2M48_01880, partial [Clostridiales bacterium]|nr:hypothetical protein [Clostridiales bacterium]